jgi:uncharacterized protein YbaP (TraB family)
MSRHLALAFILSSLVAQSMAQRVVHAFSVSDDSGRRSVLIPSLHVPASGIAQPLPGVLQDEKSFLVIEHLGKSSLDTSEGESMAPWAKKMTSVQQRTYFTRARCAGLEEHQAERMLRRASVQVANQLAYTSCAASRQPSRDNILMTAAKVRGKPIVPLEDDQWVEGQRRKVPPFAQEQAFFWILDRDVDSVLRPVVEAFNAGDFDAVLSLTAASWGSPENAQAMSGPMISARNVQWMQTLPPLLAKGGAVIDVGAAHIPGPEGLLALLQAKGYRVDPITLPAAP